MFSTSTRSTLSANRSLIDDRFVKSTSRLRFIRRILVTVSAFGRSCIAWVYGKAKFRHAVIPPSDSRTGARAYTRCFHTIRERIDSREGLGCHSVARNRFHLSPRTFIGGSLRHSPPTTFPAPAETHSFNANINSITSVPEIRETRDATFADRNAMTKCASVCFGSTLAQV